MGCFVLRNNFLQFFEGKVANVDYEFACEHTKQTQQDKCTYFAVELDPFLFGCKDQQQQKNQNQKTFNILAGILYCEQDFAAQNARSFILNAIKANIYFQLRQYREGFRNILIAIDDYTKSSDSQIQGYRIVINLLMRIDGYIYLSNSIKSINNQLSPILNEWKILRQDEKQFRDLDKKEELNTQGQYFYMIKEQYAPLIKEIILTSNKCSTYNMYNDLRKKYPQKSCSPSIMYFLKLKNINL